MLLAALAAGSACAQAPAGGAAPVCFTAADNARLPFQVFQQAPPPAPRARAYPYYPLTAAASMQLGSLSRAAPGVDGWYFQWANRSNAPLYNLAGQVVARKANLQPRTGQARRQRTAFTSFDRADACTLAQTAHVLGRDDEAARLAQAAGLRLLGEATTADTGERGPDDACVLAAGRLPPQARGVLLDFEAQDGRGADRTLALFTRFAALVHGANRKAMLLMNPFDAPTHRYSGISAANANRIVRTFDLTTIQLWSRNAQGSLPASYAKQMAMIRAGGPVDPARLVIDFELAGTTLADAAFVHRTILADRLAGVMFWRNLAPQGGDCGSEVNRKIATVLTGGAGR